MAERGRVSSYVKKGKRYWRIRISIDGKLTPFNNHRGVPFESEKHAERVLGQIQDRLADEDAGPDEATRVAEFLNRRAKPNLVSTLMAEFEEDFEAKCRKGKKSYNTLRNFRANNRKHYGPFFGRMSLGEIRDSTMKRFVREMEDKDLEPLTIRELLKKFHVFLAWCKAESKGMKTLPVFPKIEVPEKEPPLLTLREQREVLYAIPWAQRGIFLMLCLGVRPNAARAIRVEDVERGGIHVRHGVQGPSIKDETGRTKAWKENWVPMTKELEAWVKEHKRDRLPSALLFWNPDGRTKGLAWGHQALTDVWDRASAAAGVKRIQLYKATKHSFATGRLMLGADQGALADFMQITPSVLDVYAKRAAAMRAQILNPGEVADEAAKLLDSMLRDVPPPWSLEQERLAAERRAALPAPAFKRRTAGRAGRAGEPATGELVANRVSRPRKSAKS